MRAGWVVVTVALGLAGFRFLAQEPAGNRAYRGGDYAKAAQRYRRALADGEDTPRLRHNLGTALLWLEENEAARDHLTRALEARSPGLRALAFYHLGNAHAVTSEGRTTERDLVTAIDAYKRALLLDPQFDDARWNLELATQRLRQLRSTVQSDADEPPSESDRGEGGGAPERPQGMGGAAPAPGSERGGAGVEMDRAGARSPLPIELAEQILRAVEEQERSLQREKLRSAKQRVTGPDW